MSAKCNSKYNKSTVCISYLLFVPLSGQVAFLDAPVPEEVSEVPEDGEDAVAHIGENRHKQRSLLKLLHKRFVVQAGITNNMVVLEEKKIHRQTEHGCVADWKGFGVDLYMQF